VKPAPGGPGAGPSWGPGRKQGFGKAPGSATRVWFTIARGNLSDTFYPTLDHPCLHELRFLVAAPGSPPVDDAPEADHAVRWLEPGVPAFQAVSTHLEYRLEKEFAPDPELDAVLVSGEFHPDLPDLRLFVQASSHLAPGGPPNDAYVLDRDPPVLVLHQGDGRAWIAVVGPFDRALAGFLESSDLLVELHDTDGRLVEGWDEATGGNATVGARLGVSSGAFQLAIGFAPTREEAEDVARRALQRGARAARGELARAVREQPDLPPNLLRVAGDGGALARASVTVLRSLEDSTYRGGFVAAPGAPWGESVEDGDQVYHLVWPRDLYHVVTGLLEAGDPAPAQRALGYLESRQRSDGGWPQNFRLDGTPHWDGSELDEIAYPVLLAWRLGVAGALDRDVYSGLVRRALRLVVTTGPATELDRWEDAGGLSPSSLAVAIAALAAGAAWADDAGDPAGGHFRRVADYWFDRLEAWTYLRPYRHFVRLNPDPDRPPPPDAAVALEFLELVRLGLIAAADPRVEHSLTTADAVLRSDLPAGPAWRRYAGDSYGEAPDGSPWRRGAGIGRPWPLLTGMRAQVAQAQGVPVGDAITALEGFAGPELMLPEQVWDGDDLPSRSLFRGRATGSAAPLGWAHAEYLKLLAAVAGSRQPDAVEPARRRYSNPPPAPPFVWHPAHDFETFLAGRRVVIQLDRPGTVRWSADGWATFTDVALTPTGLELWIAELSTERQTPGGIVEWTARFEDGWEGVNHRLTCTAPD
jgi:glucoamylase